ncbi:MULTISPECIES: efflux RND transporter periplasmic adaptor subunit [Microvirgula]|uniref:efflux RND transporter periplasmic adaptor subunit n=1 Tax=Microvirgula TaxID=57479 RepID=UPI00048E873C|nr:MULTISPECIES: efflux RND transporter periplasmic adaptor subunit [Microvirgula]RAS19009.1 membrane fusion protein (multidrug efflux system) [Microvirgula sp. AG722]
MQINRTVAQLTAAGILLSGSILLTGCGKKDAPPPPGPQEVSVVSVVSQQLAMTTELPGRTSSFQIAEVRPQVGGIIQKRLFREGADVKAGQPLYQIDPATYRAAYDSARATLAKADANLTTARLKAERYRELVSINAVSKQEYDDADAAFKQAAADVAGARAAVESARINLDYTRVSSPISGRIGKSTVTPGALVTQNQADALTTVQQIDPIYVDVTQSSTEVLRLRRELESGKLARAGNGGARVKLRLEDGSDYAHEGRLEFSDITVDQGTGAITIRAVFPNPERNLLPGMYVRAVLEEGVNDQAILVPQQGVTRNHKGEATALVVGQDNKVAERVLNVSRTIGDKWLVNSGLKQGDRVIVEGLQKVHPGAVVKPVPAKPAKPAPQAAAAKP